MFRSLLKRLVKRVVGQKPPPPTPQKRYEPPPPPKWMSQEHEHSHEHSHGHSHEHDHTHEVASAEDTATPTAQNAVKSDPVDIIPIETPNPNAYKFSVSKKITDKSFSASSTKDAAGHELAEALIAHTGVASVFGVNDFVTVTKQQEDSWDDIIPDVIEILQRLV